MKLRAKLLHPASFLALLAILAYAPFFWERGFYWDEAPWTWIYFRLGPAALTQTFSTSRPFWGLLYQATLPLLGANPWVWQVLMVILRWLSALLVWLILRRLAPASRLPLWASALFLVYPGLGQNFIALMYSHFYLVLNAFLFSLWLSLRAIQKQDGRYHLAALLFSAINLLAMEYFYFLEFFRLLLFWHLLPQPKLRRAALAYLPYLALFFAVTFWRAFFFTNQNASYTYQTLQDLQTNLFTGLGKLLLNMLLALWETLPHAFLLPFSPPNFATLGLLTGIGAFALAFAATLLTGIFLHSAPVPAPDSAPRTFVWMGAAAWVLGGGALWLVGERTMPQLHFSADRFTLPFMLGASLLLAGFLGFLSRRPRLQLTLLSLLIGFSVGWHFQVNATYRRDWDTQRNFFWQMSWRIPALQPGTTLLSNDLPLTVFSDNSLSGPLNWIYSSPGRMDTILYFASVRTQEGRALGENPQPNTPITQNYLASTFYGNTSQMIVVNFAPPGCFRILDPEIDPLNKLLPPPLRDAAFLSNPAAVLPNQSAQLPSFYAPEVARGWCYLFSQAEIARQNGDWQQVVEIYQQAQSLGERPNDPLENFVFIEAFAHTGDWQNATLLTKQSYRFSKEVMRPMLCALWERIERETSPNPRLNAVRAEISCP